MNYLRNPEYDLAIFIAGPGTSENHQLLVNYNSDNFNNVITIGDGKQDLQNEDQDILSDHLNSLEPYISNDYTKKILVFICIHGNVYNDKHILFTREDKFGL